MKQRPALAQHTHGAPAAVIVLAAPAVVATSASGAARAKAGVVGGLVHAALAEAAAGVLAGVALATAGEDGLALAEEAHLSKPAVVAVHAAVAVVAPVVGGTALPAHALITKTAVSVAVALVGAAAAVHATAVSAQLVASAHVVRRAPDARLAAGHAFTARASLPKLALIVGITAWALAPAAAASVRDTGGVALTGAHALLHQPREAAGLRADVEVVVEAVMSVARPSIPHGARQPAAVGDHTLFSLVGPGSSFGVGGLAADVMGVAGFGAEVGNRYLFTACKALRGHRHTAGHHIRRWGHPVCGRLRSRHRSQCGRLGHWGLAVCLEEKGRHTQQRSEAFGHLCLL